MTLGDYGIDLYGDSPYGGLYPPYGLESATPLSATLVRVRYTAIFNPLYGPLLNPNNYSIFPSVAVHSVILESSQTVLLVVDPLAAILYTLTITTAEGYFGQPLDPSLASVQFLGVLANPTFYAVATRSNRVRAVFTNPMYPNSELTDPVQYILEDLDHNLVTIDSITTEQSTSIRSVVLHLGEDLVDERHYRLTILSGVVSEDMQNLLPDKSLFQWVDNPLEVSIPLDRFSGASSSEQFSGHNGAVFFSPAMPIPAANSIIQVEEIDVCTRAYDEYQIPQPVDPPLFTFFDPNAPATSWFKSQFNSDASFWAPFPRLVEARFALNMVLEDQFETAQDLVGMIMQQTLDPLRVSLLNNADWVSYVDDASTPVVDSSTIPPLPATPWAFRFADNTGSPMLPGPFTVVYMPMAGNSSMQTAVQIAAAVEPMLGESDMATPATAQWNAGAVWQGAAGVEPTSSGGVTEASVLLVGDSDVEADADV